jgi:hypothetical protein
MSVTAAAWEQREDEPPKAFAAFRAFRDAGPNRSVLDVYRQAKGKPEASQAPGTWNRWVGRFEWQPRARAFDERMESIRLVAIEDAERKRAAIWAERATGWPEIEYRMAHTLMHKAHEITRGRATTVADDPQGDPAGQTIILPVESLDLQRAASVAREAAALGRAAIASALGIDRLASTTVGVPIEPSTPVSQATREAVEREIEEWTAKQRELILSMPRSAPTPDGPTTGGPCRASDVSTTGWPADSA